MSKYDPNENLDSLDELWRRDGDTRSRVTAIERKRIMGVWQNPVLLNGWAIVDGMMPYQYRIVFSDTFQDRGIIDGGASGSVAYIVAEPWRGHANFGWVGGVLDASPFQPAMFFMDVTTGEVTVTF